MKIATMVRGFLPAPAPSDVAYSPISIAISVAEGLAAKGHSVTFFGPEGTDLETEVETLGVRPLVKNDQDLNEMLSTMDLFQQYLPSLYDQYMVKAMFERAANGEFDLLLFNHPESSMGYASLYPTVSVVYILHDYLDEKRKEVIEMHQSPNQHYVSISNSQRRDAPDLPYIATIYNGIDTELFSYCDKAEDYLVYAGRIAPQKGVREAVQVAIRTDKRLLIIGHLLRTDQWYFDEHIKPYLSDRILYLGMIDKVQLAKYYQKAQALLMPIQWEEPFGLTMAEAMSCGTPVVAFGRGSVPEVIKDGKTGFIVDSTATMVEAIEKIATIDRKDCRTHVERNFTVARMVSDYEKVLESLIMKPVKLTPEQSKFIKKMKILSEKLAEKLR